MPVVMTIPCLMSLVVCNGRAVGPGGMVVGIDVNAELVAAAEGQLEDARRADASADGAALHGSMSVSVGDAADLPVAMGGTFDVVREDRLLQHLTRRAPAIAMLMPMSPRAPMFIPPCGCSSCRGAAIEVSS